MPITYHWPKDVRESEKQHCVEVVEEGLKKKNLATDENIEINVVFPDPLNATHEIEVCHPKMTFKILGSNPRF